MQSQGTESQFGSPAHSAEARVLLALHEDSLTRGAVLLCSVQGTGWVPLPLGGVVAHPSPKTAPLAAFDYLEV